jgi:Fe-S cluster biosynthesis and repair protein YggX
MTEEVVVPNTVACSRCGRAAEALETPPLPDKIGEEIQARCCRDCWSAWQQAEVMVINELRLNFMDPKAPDILHLHMREFLGLEPNQS